MAYYAKIQDLINSVKGVEISYRNLHCSIMIRNNDEIIKLPFSSVIKKYMDFLEPTAVECTFNDGEKKKYRFAPKKISAELYGTTEFWSAILELNNMVSIIDFDTVNKTVKVFEPKEFMSRLNEILILEGIIK